MDGQLGLGMFSQNDTGSLMMDALGEAAYDGSLADKTLRKDVHNSLLAAQRARQPQRKGHAPDGSCNSRRNLDPISKLRAQSGLPPLNQPSTMPTLMAPGSNSSFPLLGPPSAYPLPFHLPRGTGHPPYGQGLSAGSPMYTMAAPGPTQPPHVATSGYASSISYSVCYRNSSCNVVNCVSL